MLITQAHFGSNIMYSGHSTEPGSALERFSDWMGATNFRYPGGTVTEQMSHRDGSLDIIFEEPNRGAGFLQDVTTLREALNFADARDGDITFVLPTTTFLTEGEYGTRSVDMGALDQFMGRIDEMIKGVYGPPVIRTFEIGNEWWLFDQRMTAEEYGQIANEYAKGLKRVFDEHRASLDDPNEWVAPNIAVQSGAYWRGPESNTTIIESLDPEAKEAINMVIAHFYPRNLAQAQGASSRWDALEEFKQDEAFGDLKILFSEWNISTHSDMKGMNQASLLVETFATMIEKGVDEANIWGTNYKHLSTKLANMSHNRWENIAPEDVDLDLMPAGEVYRMLAKNLVGKTVLDVDVERVILNVDANNMTEILLTQAFGSAEQITVFISNRGMDPATFQINEALIPDDFTHVWAEYMTAHDDPLTMRDEGDPTSEHARAYVSTRNSEQIFDAIGRINLGGYDIIRLSFTKEGVGVEMNGSDQVVDRSLPMSDHLIGGTGNDIIDGEIGNDILEGREGHDIIFGGTGNDRLIGGEGNDLLIADYGNNTLEGVTGVNILVSGVGSDRLIGGDGNDLFFAMGDQATITGNGGGNIFHFSGSGDYTVTDFNPEKGDLLSFGGRFKSDLQFINSMVVENQTDKEDGDLVFYDNETEMSVRLLGSGGLLADAEDFVLDFFSGQDRASELSLYFNNLTDRQLEVFLDQTVTEAETCLFQGITGNQFGAYFSGSKARMLCEEYDSCHEIGGEGNDLLIGDKENNFLEGVTGTNILVSGEGANRLIGGDGNDLFYAKGEQAMITGNGGINLFHFSGSGQYTVTDFNPDNGDLLSFGGRFKNDLQFIDSMIVKNQSDKEDGDLVFYDKNSEMSVRLLGQGGLLADAENFVLDFLPEDQRANELSLYFNEMTDQQLEAFLEHTASDSETDLFQGLTEDQFIGSFGASKGQMLCEEYDPDYQTASAQPEQVSFVASAAPTGAPLSSRQPDGSQQAPDEELSPFDPNPPSEAYTGSGGSIWHEAERLLSALEASSQRYSEQTNQLENEQNEDDEDGAGRKADVTCFVATAAYRDPLHPDVVFLRHFRDELLNRSYLGRKFITIYWNVGPVLARPVQKSDLLATISIRVLKILIFLVKSMWREH